MKIFSSLLTASLLFPLTSFASTSYYGMPYQVNSLNNSSIGNKWDRALAFSITAEHSEEITHISWYNKNNDPKNKGYTSGNGGDIQVLLYKDKGGSPDLTQLLGSTNILNKESGLLSKDADVDCEPEGANVKVCNRFPKLEFHESSNGSLQVQKGERLHIVFVNRSIDPTNNYVSVNLLRAEPTTQPENDERVLSGAYFHSTSNNVVWRNFTDQINESSIGNTPIYELSYNNNKFQGTSVYQLIEADGTSAQSNKLYTTADKNQIRKMRQTFKFKGNSSTLFNKLKWRLKKVGAPGQLKARLLEINPHTGSEIEISYSYLSTSFSPSNYEWATSYWNKTVSLQQNQTYAIELVVACGVQTCPSSTGAYYEFLPYQTTNSFSDDLSDFSDGEVLFNQYTNGIPAGWDTIESGSNSVLPLYLLP